MRFFPFPHTPRSCDLLALIHFGNKDLFGQLEPQTPPPSLFLHHHTSSLINRSKSTPTDGIFPGSQWALRASYQHEEPEAN